jgi:hypothetical protein
LALLRGCLALLLRLRSLVLLLLLGCLALLRSSLMLLWSSLTLLLNRLTLLLLLDSLMLLLLLNGLMLLLLLTSLMLLLNCLALLLLDSLIVHLDRRRDSHVAICGERLVDGHAGWTAMIHIRKLSPVGAGSTLILNLRPHRRSMLFMPRCQFRRSGAHLHAALPAVETHACAALAVIVHAAVVNVMLD